MRVPPDDFIQQTPMYKILLSEASRLQHLGEESASEVQKLKAEVEKLQTEYKKEKEEQQVRFDVTYLPSHLLNISL